MKQIFLSLLLVCMSFFSFAIAPITGSSSVCYNANITLSDATTGGTWSSSNTSVATIGSLTGTVTGVGTGTSIITYTVGVAYATTTVTVKPVPAPIIGTLAVCVGYNNVMHDFTAGGTWSSSVSGVASIGIATGIETGIAPGTSVISYTLSNGCYSTQVSTVLPTPAPITGTFAICNGTTAVLSDTIVGGTWSGTDASVMVNLVTGSVSGILPGTATIIYTLSTGCSTTHSLTVFSTPTAITGPLVICLGSSVILSDGVAGGTWSSSNTAVASIISSSGLETGISAGTAQITYQLAAGCMAISVTTVTPVPSAISVVSPVCVGQTDTLRDGVGGGIWASSNTAVATIGSSSGVVSGISFGTSQITYSIGLSCSVTSIISVNFSPTPITGVNYLCTGASAFFNDFDAGGVWRTSNSAVAGIDSLSALVTGVSAGTAVITYMYYAGCYAFKEMTVVPSPAPITGSFGVCDGMSTTLNDATSGGTWSSGSIGIATVLSSGAASGIAPGNTTITYELSSGCYSVHSFTVLPSPGPINGPPAICLGSSVTLSDGVAGGTWSSSNTAVAAIVSSSGLETGISAGTAQITYQLATGCMAISVTTVTPVPSAISGAYPVCVGSSVTLGNSVSGGTWESSNTAVAIIGSSTGLATGISSGTCIISYNMGGGCRVTHTFTVLPSPGPISGSGLVCIGSVISLGDSISGGTWSSSNVIVATAGSSTGLETGISTGTALISYILPSGCYSTLTTRVASGFSSPISGSGTICAFSSASLADSLSGGIWSSSSTAIAPIGSVSGILTAITPGSATITYHVGGCSAITAIETILAAPGPISGGISICTGSSAALGDAVSGGVWSSSNTAVATIGSASGLEIGVSAGSSLISYKLSSGCYAVTVSRVASSFYSPITGPDTLCSFSSILLTDSIGGGVWTSSNTGIATIGSSSGLMTGVSPGTTLVTYSIGGCGTMTFTETVIAGPPAITGISLLCVGGSTTLSDGTTGGTWSSSISGVATIISSLGLETGVSAGTTIITYRISDGCYTTFNARVTNSTATSPITGIAGICAGSSIALADSLAGGSWTSSNTAVGAIGNLSGILTGIATGTTIITYRAGCGLITAVDTVILSPTPVSGSPILCLSSSATLTDAISGGSWTSSNTAVATVISSLGIETGLAAGTTLITYALSTGCFTTKTTYVVSGGGTVSGIGSICTGSSTILFGTVPGGAWSSSNVAIASIGTSTGIVNGVSAGFATITYTVGSCGYATLPMTIVQSPFALTGPSTVCRGNFLALSDTYSGGIWSSANPGIASFDSLAGTLTGISAGTTNITYTIGHLCSVSRAYTVNPSPSAISGTDTACLGLTATLTDSVAGGMWTSGNILIAVVGSSSGVVTAVATGTTLISYTLPGACTATYSFLSVSPSISGFPLVCTGGGAALSAWTGGTWSSSNSLVATIGSSSGVITGVSPGSVVVIYTSPTGCVASSSELVINSVPAISGIRPLCPGFSETLTDSLAGGTWSSSNVAVAAYGSATGNFVSAGVGICTITYSFGTGCLAHATFTVNPLPALISGHLSLCLGDSSMLTDATTGGIWLSGNTSVATINSLSGEARGVSAGADNISYILPTGCLQSTSLIINPVPGAISGTGTVCQGGTSTLTDSVTGGQWTSSNPSAATIGSASGLATGILTGSLTITYTLPGGCYTDFPLAVIPGPAPIMGPDTLCTSDTIMLSDSSAGGTWSCTGITLNDLTGVIYDGPVGVHSITYTVSTGCSSFFTLNIVNCLNNGVSGPLAAESAISLYPNPANDELTLKTAPGLFYVYQLINETGQQLMRGNITGSETRIQVKALAPGIYFIKILGDNGYRALQFRRE